MTLENIFKAENLPIPLPMDKAEEQGYFVAGQTRTSGSFALDYCSGVWGYPKDRIIEIFGDEGTGKTTLTLMACAIANRFGKKALFVDVEHGLNMPYAYKLGVKKHLFYVQQPGSAEEALKLAKTGCKADDVGVVVVDSVASLATQAEIDGEVGDHHIAQVARLMSMQLKQLTAICSTSDTLLIFTNQNRVNPGAYGSVYQCGGRALKFYASVRISLKKKETLKDPKTKQAYANLVEATFVKNRLGSPYTSCIFELVFGKGINNGKSIIEEGTRLKVLEKKGSWISYGDKQLGQGMDATAKLITKDLVLKKELIAKIKEATRKKPIEKKVKGKVIEVVADVSDEDEGVIVRSNVPVVQEAGEEE